MLGIAAAGLVGWGILEWNAGDTGLAGVLIRVGAVLGAAWIAHPALVAFDRRTAWLLGVGAVVVLIRPRSAIVVLPVIALFARNAQLRRSAADE
jgi:hypothetical protein